MIPTAEVLGYIITIVVTIAVKYFVMKYLNDKKRRLLVNILNNIADMVADRNRAVANALKNVAWYIEHDKLDATSMLEDVQNAIGSESGK